jgi:hypothetical protein
MEPMELNRLQLQTQVPHIPQTRALNYDAFLDVVCGNLEAT